MKKRTGFLERTAFFAIDVLISYVILRGVFHAPHPGLLAYLWASVSTSLYFIEKAVGSR